MHTYDRQYMHEALLLARAAVATGDVPIGAVIVSPYGEIIGTGKNEVELCNSQEEHAEIVALRRATKMMNDWRLDGCTMYVTLEPCIMCIGAILLSRIERLVYGCTSPIYGFSQVVVEPEVLYGGFLKNITRGVLERECQDLLQEFFANVR